MLNVTRTCNKCGKTFDLLAGFDIIQPYKTYRGSCKLCRLKYRADKVNRLLSTPEGLKFLIIRNLYNGAKGRAKKNKLPFNLSKEYIGSLLTEKCPVLGFTYVYGHNDPHSASIDKVDNDKGYVVGNVAIICRRANSLKKDATLEELELIVKYIETNTT